MARGKGNTRDVRIRFAIDGEKELNAQIGRLNAEFKKLETSLKLSKAEFAGQLNTEKALSAQLGILKQQYQNTANALTVYENKQKAINNAIAEAEKTLDGLHKELESAPDADAYDKTATKIQMIERALENLKKALENNEAKINKTKIRQGELNARMQKTTGYLNEARNSFGKTAKSIDEYGNKVKKADKAMEYMAELEKLELLNGKIEQLRNILTECVEAAQAFDLSIKGVEKTVDGIDGEALRQMVLDMSTEMPIDANTLAQIAQGGGQYGISTGGLEEYIRTIANLTVSTDITADTGAQNLARFVGLMQESEDKFENIGSVITALGNTTKTTESQILDMATGIASAGHLAGMSATDVLALSAALSSAGIESQAGSSSMSTFIVKIASAVEEGGEAVQGFADISGKTAEEFKASWKNDALGTIVSIIDGLSEMEKAGGNVFGVLSDIGVSEIRMRRAILGLATSEGTLEKSLLTANTAWDENIALMAEASKFYEADANKKQVMINQFERLKISVGDAAAPALERFYELLGKGAEGLAKLNEEAPGFVQVLSALVIGLSTFTGLAVGVVALSKAFTALKDALVAVNAATGLTTLTLGGWVYVATGVIATLGVLITSFKDYHESVRTGAATVQEFAKEQKKNDEALEASAKSAQIHLDKIIELEKEYGEAAGQQEAYTAAVEGLRAAMPEMNFEIDEQTGLLKENTQAIKENIDAWIEAERERFKYEQNEQMLRQVFELENQLEEAKKNLEETIADNSYVKLPRKAIAESLARQTVEDIENQIDALTKELNNRGIDYKYETSAKSGAEDPWTQVSEGMEGLALAAPNYANDAIDPWRQRMEELAEEAIPLREAFAEAFEAVRSEMESTFSVFDRFDEKSGMSLKEFKRNMEDNIEAMQGYRDNLQAVFDNDQLSDGFKTWIANQDPEAVYELLEDLASATDEELAEIQNIWDTNEEEMDKTAGDVAVKSGEIADIVLEGMKDADQSAVAYVSGSLTVQGLISGLNSQKRALQDKANEISAIFSSAYRRTNKLASPSKLFREYGRYDIQGLILGHEDMREKLEKSSERLAGVTANSFKLAAARMSANLSFNSHYNAKDYTSILNKMYKAMHGSGVFYGGTPTQKVSASAKKQYERQLVTRLLY